MSICVGQLARIRLDAKASWYPAVSVLLLHCHEESRMIFLCQREDVETRVSDLSMRI